MFPKEARQAILDEFMRYAGVQMALVMANPAPADDDMTLADLDAVEADYAGYARQNIPDPGASTIDGLDQATDTTATMTFQPVGLVSPQTIYGYYLTFESRNLATVELWQWVRLLTPVVLATDASQFVRVITIDVQTYNP
jgi:hypothetical protein